MITLNNALKLIKTFPKYLIPVGSVIRGKKNIKDMDFITTKKLNDVLQYFSDNFDIAINKHGNKFIDFTLKLNHPIGINIWKTTKKEYPFAYFARAYPVEFNRNIRMKMKRLGFKLNDKGLFDNNDKLISVKNYKNIFKLVDIPYRTPQEQEIKENERKK